METRKAYYIGTHPNSFRSGEPAEIIDFKSVKVGNEWRSCFMVRYADGREDSCAASDHGNYKIVDESEVREALTTQH